MISDCVKALAYCESSAGHQCYSADISTNMEDIIPIGPHVRFNEHEKDEYLEVSEIPRSISSEEPQKTVVTVLTKMSG